MNIKELNLNQVMDWINTLFDNSGWVFRTRIPGMVMLLQRLFDDAEIKGILSNKGVKVIVKQNNLARDEAFLLIKSLTEDSVKLRSMGDCNLNEIEANCYSLSNKITYLKCTCDFKESELVIFIPANPDY